MKAKLIAGLLVILLAAAGCSSGGKSDSAADKLASINTMMAKGYEMSENQRQTINGLVAEGRKLMSEGKKEEAAGLFDQALKDLEVIAETDRFNKSE